MNVSNEGSMLRGVRWLARRPAKANASWKGTVCPRKLSTGSVEECHSKKKDESSKRV